MLPTTLLTIAFLVLLTAAGVYVTWTALFPKRRGRTRFCRSCGYNLTGNTSGRCPECGRRVRWSSGVVKGEARRRPGRAALGIVLLLPGFTSLALVGFARLRGIVLYQHVPVRLLVHDLRSENAGTFCKAADELCRRLNTRQLSAAQFSEGVETCLDRFGQMTVERGFSQELIDWLGDLYLGRSLTVAQTERFFEHTVKLRQLEARPTAVRGGDCALAVHHELHLPSRWLYATVAARSIRLGGRVVQFIDEEMGGVNQRGPHIRRFPLWFRPDEAGRQIVAVDFDISLYTDLNAKLMGMPPLHQRSATLETVVEVFAEEPADYITLLSSPELNAQIASLVSIPVVEGRYRPGFGALDGAAVEIEFQPGLPIDVAFEAFVEVDGQWYAVGTVAARQGNTNVVTVRAQSKLTPPLPSRVAVRLEGTTRAAERTLDMNEVWGGELEFTNVRAQPVPAHDAPWRSLNP